MSKSIDAIIVSEKTDDGFKNGIVVNEDNINTYFPIECKAFYYILKKTIGNKLPIDVGKRIRITIDVIEE